MEGRHKVPAYAIRLVVLLVSVGVVFFVGLQLFVPEGSKLTGSYDAKSLLYVAAQPVSYQGSASCGKTNCHEAIFSTWSQGAHGRKKEQSKCEVCHGPQGTHPANQARMVKVRGDGNIVELCLTCHRKLKARSTTGQPQISPQEHPYPHKDILKCTQCHNPHSPGFNKPEASSPAPQVAGNEKSAAPAAESLATNCFPCHGPSGRGGFAPVLAGQSSEVIKDKLTKFRSGELTNPMMSPVASKLKDQEIDMLAAYFAKLP